MAASKTPTKVLSTETNKTKALDMALSTIEKQFGINQDEVIKIMTTHNDLNHYLEDIYS